MARGRADVEADGTHCSDGSHLARALLRCTDLTSHQIPEPGMRAFVAAAIGLAAALALVFAITAFGVPEGKTSPKPLLTTAPAAPGQD